MLYIENQDEKHFQCSGINPYFTSEPNKLITCQSLSSYLMSNFARCAQWRLNSLLGSNIQPGQLADHYLTLRKKYIES